MFLEDLKFPSGTVKVNSPSKMRDKDGLSVCKYICTIIMGLGAILKEKLTHLDHVLTTQKTGRMSTVYGQQHKWCMMWISMHAKGSGPGPAMRMTHTN